MSEVKTILVTGCTSGIGFDLVHYLKSCGYEVVLVGRNVEKLKLLSENLNARYIVCDICIDSQIKDVFETLKSDGVKLNGMVHCAGTGSNVPIRLFHEEEMREQMQVHFYSFIELLKFFYRKDISFDDASVIAVSSIAVQTKRKGSTLYTAAMSAINSAVSIASKEFIKRKIRVNSIMPAYVDTRMNADLSQYINIDDVQPMGLIPTRSISELIEFLLSDKSKYITGATIPVSAGMEF